MKIDKQERNIEILRLLSSGFSPQQVSKEIGLSRMRVSQIRKDLKRRGLLTETGELSEPGQLFLEGECGLSVRLHGLVIRIEPLLKSPEWFKAMNKIFTVHTGRMANLCSRAIVVDAWKVRTNSRAVFLHVPHIWAHSREEAAKKLMEMFFAILPKLEARLGVPLYKDGKTNITIISQHFAIVGATVDEFFNALKPFGISEIQDENNEVVFFFDNSLKDRKELESTDPLEGGEKTDNLRKHMVDMARNPLTFSELSAICEANAQANKANTEAISSITEKLDTILDFAVKFFSSSLSHCETRKGSGWQGYIR